MVYLDFSRSEDAKAAFSDNIDDAVELAAKIANVDAGGDIDPGSTLIFLDEIQECPRARTALKTFSESGLYDVIASGSLIDAVIRDETVFIPVGYEEQMVMRSLDFEEFLWAMNVSDTTIADVRRCIHDARPIPEVYRRKFSEMFVNYMLVGGMPEAVSTYTETKSYDKAQLVLRKIRASCVNDIGKYGGRDRTRIEECFESIPYQLAQSNKKFMYTRVGIPLTDDETSAPATKERKDSRKARREYGDSLTWIRKAAIGNYCFALNAPAGPLEGHCNNNQFKVYMSDTGLLLSMYSRRTRRAIFNRTLSIQAGAITENVIAECIAKAGIGLFYFSKTGKENRMEIDFVAEIGDDIVAIEVKSGKDRQAPSLSKVQKVYPSVDRRVMFEDADVSVDDDGVEHYPFFAAGFIDELDRDDGTSPINI
ncbi:MAG: DUF4143 domain-containing protein [Thermoplasmata archaeon]|nr:DUF4143 domain-containing protein [Thermoplasmata archaeon]